MAVTIASNSEPIPGYRLIERLGRGGFGEVWKCEAPGGFLKAIKFVYGNLEGIGDDGKPAEQERKALERIRQIRHPFVLSLERYDIVDGQLMIVMELADRSLWDRFRDCRAANLPGIPRDELLRYMEEASEALDIMNQEHNLQHLDIKPQNPFIVHSHVKVADFGLVKVFEGLSASVTGGVTPVYAAPETFEQRVTRHSDQYSLAVVYQELLTGVRPFNGTNTRQLILQHLSEPPDLESLPEGDRGPVGRALAKLPGERFGSSQAFVRALRAQAVSATVPGVAPGGRLGEPPAGVATTPLGLPSTVETQFPAPRAPAMEPPPHPARKPSNLLTRREGRPAPDAAPPTLARPAAFSPSQPFSDLPIAPPEQKGPGVLRPALIVGVGGLGRRVVQQWRRGVKALHGDASLPHVRTLFLDTDPEAARESRSVVALPLNRPSYYLSRGESADDLAWLSKHLLYRMPRNPATLGLRALGRLAFWDHAAALETRLRDELLRVGEPAALAEAQQSTGLGLCSNRPRVYLVAGATGGTGSGMVLDLAYLARHVLISLGYMKPEVVGVLLVPTAKPAGKLVAGLANAHATLLELRHYAQPGTRYEARLGSRALPLRDTGAPLQRCVLVSLGPSAEERQQRRAVGLAAGIVERELLSPIGRCLDGFRTPDADPKGCGLESAGSFRIHWPRERHLLRGGSALARHLVQTWIAKDGAAQKPRVADWLESQWTERALRPEDLVDQYQDAAREAMGESVEIWLQRLLAPTEAESKSGVDLAQVRARLHAIVEMLGRPPSTESENDPPATLVLALTERTRALSAAYEKHLAEFAVQLIEKPTYRLAAADEAIRQLDDRLRQMLNTYEAMSKSLAEEAADIFPKLIHLIAQLGASTHSRKTAALAHDTLHQLRLYAQKRCQGLISDQVQSIYRNLLNATPEYLREVSFCRQQLGEVRKFLDSEAGHDRQPSGFFGPGREIFPGGATHLTEATENLVALLTAEEIGELDARVQEQVRAHFRSLVTYCLEASGVARPMAEVLVRAAQEFLADKIGQAGTLDLYAQQYGSQPDAARALAREAIQESTPLEGRAIGKKPPARHTFVALPDDPRSEAFLARLVAEFPATRCERVASPDELVVYQAEIGLDWSALPPLGPEGRKAFDAQLAADLPPHTRRDVAWTPPPVS